MTIPVEYSVAGESERGLPLSLPDSLQVEYQRDLDDWTKMVESWGNVMTWRDEQSFKRGWLVGRGVKP
jgi:hypothetical protein